MSEEEVQALVVDNGSGMCKAGFEGDDVDLGPLLDEARASVERHRAEVVQEARMRAPHTLRVVVEVADAAGALVALAADADVILLDNMEPAQLLEAVAWRDRNAEGVLLEASGGITLEKVGAVAATGEERESTLRQIGFRQYFADD